MVFIAAIPLALMLLLMILAGRYRAEFYLFLLVLVCVALNAHCCSLSKLKNILLAMTATLISAILVFNNVMVERKSIFDCEPGVIPRALKKFYQCPAQNYQPLSVSNAIYFNTLHPENHRALKQGWSAPESWGIWLDGENAELQIQIATQNSSEIIVLTYNTFNPKLDSNRSVKLFVNDIFFKRIFLQNKIEKIYIPIAKIDSKENINGNLNINIKFKAINPQSPKDLGIGEDGRKLSISLISAELIKD
jgi:hypothetical protein